MAQTCAVSEINTRPLPQSQGSTHVGARALVSITMPTSHVSDGATCDLSGILATAIEEYPGAIVSSDGLFAFQYIRGTDGDPETGYFVAIRNSTGALVSGDVDLDGYNFRASFEGRE